MSWTVITIIASLAFGYVSRWVQDWREKRNFKMRVEAEYREKVKDAVYKAIEKYDEEKQTLENMSKEHRLRYIADRVTT